jgi:hypothetical protein
MDRRLSRRSPRSRLALCVGALVLAVPGVASCGFDYATDREYTPAAGVNDKTGTVDVLDTVIVAEDEAGGSGTFIASLSNNSSTDTITFESLSFGSDSTVEVAAFTPIQVKPRQVVNLADGQGIKVSGPFKAGDFVTITLTFDSGQTNVMEIPVVVAQWQWEGMDNGTGVPSPSAPPSASTSESPSASDTAVPSGSPSPS